MGGAQRRNGADERQRAGEQQLPEADLQRTDATQPPTLNEGRDRVTGGGAGDGQGADRGRLQRVAGQVWRRLKTRFSRS